MVHEVAGESIGRTQRGGRGEAVASIRRGLLVKDAHVNRLEIDGGFAMRAGCVSRSLTQSHVCAVISFWNSRWSSSHQVLM